MGKQIDPSSIRYWARGREYWIGQRVITPDGPATVTGFDPEAELNIIVTLDLDGSEWVGDERSIVPMNKE